MANILIEKKSSNVWLHTPSDYQPYIVSQFYAKSTGDDFSVFEFNGVQRGHYHYSDISIKDGLNPIETGFTSILQVMLRLEELAYVGFDFTGEVLAADSISTDPGNALQLGTDDLLFVPESLPKTKITLTDAATTVWDFSAGSYAEWTIGGNRTLSVTNLPAGNVATGTLKLIQDGTGGHTVSFTGNSADVVIKPAASAQTLIKFYWDGTSLTWFSENQASSGKRRYYMRINIDGNLAASTVDTWYSFDRTQANYDNGAFYGVYGTASAPVLSTFFSRSIGITPPPNTKLISAVQRFETMSSWGTATLETQIYSNESSDATAATAVSGNQLVTNDSWAATTTSANVRQRKTLTVQTHSAFTVNTELFIAVRKRVLSGSGMRALEFLLTFEEQ